MQLHLRHGPPAAEDSKDMMIKTGSPFAPISALFLALVTLFSTPLLAQQKKTPPSVQPPQAGRDVSKDVSKKDLVSQNGRATSVEAQPDGLHTLNTALQSLTARVSPAIVEILVSGFGPVDQQSSRTAYYGRQHSLGSGVILDPSGYIMTNAHV